MLSISTIKPGTHLVLKGEPYEVLSADHHKMGRGGAILKTKLQNLISGNVISHTFQGKDSVEEADLENQKAQFLYEENEQFNFMNNETFEQFTLSREQLGDKADYLIPETVTEMLYFQGEPIGVDLPIKMKFEVKEAPPGTRGDTAQGGTKNVILETGKEVSAPLFIKAGDKIVVDTRNNSYVEKG